MSSISPEKANNTETELAGKKLDDGVGSNGGDAKGRLGIIEVEIYEAVMVGLKH